MVLPEETLRTIRGMGKAMMGRTARTAKTARAQPGTARAITATATATVEEMTATVTAMVTAMANTEAGDDLEEPARHPLCESEFVAAQVF
jgi:Neuraminidase (sialidase)